ncbi:hypothetical protein Ciccas_002910 [Cichlidogyrus casuarinus]|uniref:DUF5742 domain-containing protein n=1 Tax=Cichlidogyrus casuarinus TaxID=1844966 RepID=A0ABD2QFZ8_9PLAT
MLTVLNNNFEGLNLSRHYVEQLAQTYISLFFHRERFQNQDFVIEFQHEVIFQISVAFEHIFNASNLSSTSFKDVIHETRAQRPHFSSLIVLKNDAINLQYKRIEFLINLLRIAFLNGTLQSIPVKLPLLCSLFVSIFSVPLSSHKISGNFYTLLSLVVHFYCFLFQCFQGKLLPFLKKVLTIITFQLEWIQQNPDVTAIAVPLRQSLYRLASYSIRHSAGASLCKFSEFMSRIMDQIMVDLESNCVATFFPALTLLDDIFCKFRCFSHRLYSNDDADGEHSKLTIRALSKGKLLFRKILTNSRENELYMHPIFLKLSLQIIQHSAIPSSHLYKNFATQLLDSEHEEIRSKALETLHYVDGAEIFDQTPEIQINAEPVKMLTNKCVQTDSPQIQFERQECPKQTLEKAVISDEVPRNIEHKESPKQTLERVAISEKVQKHIEQKETPKRPKKETEKQKELPPKKKPRRVNSIEQSVNATQPENQGDEMAISDVIASFNPEFL